MHVIVGWKFHFQLLSRTKFILSATKFGSSQCSVITKDKNIRNCCQDNTITSAIFVATKVLYILLALYESGFLNQGIQFSVNLVLAEPFARKS